MGLNQMKQAGSSCTSRVKSVCKAIQRGEGYLVILCYFILLLFQLKFILLNFHPCIYT